MKIQAGTLNNTRLIKKCCKERRALTKSALDSTAAPPTNPPAPVPIEDPSCQNRRWRLNRKKSFQFNTSKLAPVEGAACVPLGDWVAVEAERVFWKATLRFVRGMRGALGVSVQRPEEDVVVYVHGVKRVGCIRQPIAAVRRVGAEHNISEV